MPGLPAEFYDGELVSVQGAQVVLDLGSQCQPTPERRPALITFRLLEVG